MNCFTMDANQDVDSTILQDFEKPNEVVNRSGTLPHYKILAGGRTLPSHTEMPIEAFVALKITNEHVLRKWKEQIHLLQQKNQQLLSEIQLLKGGLAPSETCVRGCGEACNEKELPVTSHQGNQFKDEDMYGPNATATSDLVPYNLLRLHFKLQKLQHFPHEYRSVITNVPGGSVQSRKGIFFKENGCMPSSSRRLNTETTNIASNQNASLTGMHTIKMPPQDFAHHLHKAELYNQASPPCDDVVKEIPKLNVTSGSPFPNEVDISSSSDTFPQSEGDSSHTNFLGVASISHNKRCHNQLQTSVGTEKCELPSTQSLGSRNNIEILPFQSSLLLANPPKTHLPEYESKNDLLVTVQNTTSASSTLMVCPVCSQTFPHGTKEEIVATHVHLHFDETSPQNDSFEILNE